MTDLATRIEAATGPSRELDAEIAKLIGAPHGPWERVCIESRSIEYMDEQALPYTASIDAAMTLVPDNHISGVLHHALRHIQETGFPNSTFKHRLVCEIIAAAIHARSWRGLRCRNQSKEFVMTMNLDERRGRDANLGGKPCDPSQNIDWQRGWQNAQDDRRLEDDDND